MSTDTKKKLWEKSVPAAAKASGAANAEWLKAMAELMHAFTAGEDARWDLKLAPFDVLGSIAHVRMLGSVGLLTAQEAQTLVQGLQQIAHEIESGQFQIEDGVEDVHSQVEMLLTSRLGEVGKKIHMARSRNDQVLVDLKLFLRSELEQVVRSVQTLFDRLTQKAQQTQAALIPGYTHFQVAMPSSVGLWLGAYAESLVDDLMMLQSAYRFVDRNPLGSAAGYGSSFPISRTQTTELLGFEGLHENVICAQMSRGKTERVVASGLAQIAETLSRFSMDVTLFLSQNFGFISFPEVFTTGSSIMPHKKNPDAFELIRARCNRIKSLPNEISMITTNLPSGYHRDFQILKEQVFPALAELKACLRMLSEMIPYLEARSDVLSQPQYRYAFTVEAVNQKVLEGLAFRDAYREVGQAVEQGSFQFEPQQLRHTHEGSLGNLRFEAIQERFLQVVRDFDFDRSGRALSRLRQ